MQIDFLLELFKLTKKKEYIHALIRVGVVLQEQNLSSQKFEEFNEIY